MPQYKYPVKNGVKWMAKFNYTDPKSGKAKTEYKRGFASKREAKKYEEDFINITNQPIGDDIEFFTKYLSESYERFFGSDNPSTVKTY